MVLTIYKLSRIGYIFAITKIYKFLEEDQTTVFLIQNWGAFALMVVLCVAQFRFKKIILSFSLIMGITKYALY